MLARDRIFVLDHLKGFVRISVRLELERLVRESYKLVDTK